MSQLIRPLAILAVCAALAAPRFALAQDGNAIPRAITTPAKVETRLGTLHFWDGAPNAETVAKVYDNIDFTHAYEAFVNTFLGANMAALRNGLLAAGVQDNQFIIFSELVDANSLFLTANADVVYFVSFIDLSNGPMVLETPPKSLGVIDDFWWRWVTDFGAPGPDRGEGGKYLILPPGYNGPLPEGGYYVSRARTMRVAALGRQFLVNNDPRPAVELVKKTAKIYSYVAGGEGTSIAEFLTGKVGLAQVTAPPAQVFHEGSHKVMNTIPPSDHTFYELIDQVVQQEPATALDPELMGPLAAIGIVKGKPFAPDARMKRILTDAVATANATSRTLLMNPRDPEWFYYPGSAWFNPLFLSGYKFETPIPAIEHGAAKPYPPTGYRQLDARTWFFYGYTGVTPAMAMRITGVGSQYLVATVDANKTYFDGSRTYRVTLPKDIPEQNFWSLTLYDNQTRSMLATPQRYPRAGSQSYPSPAAEPNADGSTTIYFAPKRPEGVRRGNWIQTMPGKGWFVCLRLYSPLEPFFTKQWRPSEIELIR